MCVATFYSEWVCAGIVVFAVPLVTPNYCSCVALIVNIKHYPVWGELGLRRGDVCPLLS